MTTETIFIFSVAIILLCIKPGPGQALRIATALKEGFWPAMFIALGVVLICNFYLVLASIGSNVISSFLTDSGFFFRIAAGLYLLYLGYKGLRGKKATAGKVERKKTYFQYFCIGCVLSLSNPIDIFFFMGILPGLVEVGSLSVEDIITFMVIMTVITIVIDVLILATVTQSRIALTEGGYGKIIGLIANSGLVLIGLFLLYTAFFNDNYTYSIF